jgi:hypothetical protein
MKPEDIVKQEALPEPELSAVEEAVEKRTHPRISVSLSAEIVDIKTGVRITGRVTDIGTGGCYVDTMNTFPKDTPIDVFLLWQERTLYLSAFVAYAVNGKGIGMGLSFRGNPAQARATLQEWVTELGGALPRARPQADQQRPTGRDTRLARTHRLEEIMYALITMLMRKGFLTEAEAAEFRDRIS